MNKRLTHQDVVDKVICHFILNRRNPSVSASEGCMYRSERGGRCAVGICIPEKMYNVEMEYNDANSLIHQFPFIKDLFIPEMEEDGFLMKVQNCHDSAAIPKYIGSNSMFRRLLLSKLKNLQNDYDFKVYKILKNHRKPRKLGQQDVVNRMITHYILNKKPKSISEDGYCRYRSQLDGVNTGCAVGICLPSSVNGWIHKYEGKSYCHIFYYKKEELEKIFAPDATPEFMRNMQACHDFCNPGIDFGDEVLRNLKRGESCFAFKIYDDLEDHRVTIQLVY